MTKVTNLLVIIVQRVITMPLLPNISVKKVGSRQKTVHFLSGGNEGLIPIIEGKERLFSKEKSPINPQIVTTDSIRLWQNYYKFENAPQFNYNGKYNNSDTHMIIYKLV